MNTPMMQQEDALSDDLKTIAIIYKQYRNGWHISETDGQDFSKAVSRIIQLSSEIRKAVQL